MITLYHTDKTKNVTHRGKGKIKHTTPVWWITTQGVGILGLFELTFLSEEKHIKMCCKTINTAALKHMSILYTNAKK
jgi:hypothetical protein